VHLASSAVLNKHEDSSIIKKRLFQENLFGRMARMQGWLYFLLMFILRLIA
jgi:hypothetical protein